MAEAPSTPWPLRCGWCEWLIVVNGRGARGTDPGAGVEAAELMRTHVEQAHNKTWADYLWETR